MSVVTTDWHILFNMSNSNMESKDSHISCNGCLRTPTSCHAEKIGLLPMDSEICCPKLQYLGHHLVLWWRLVSHVGIHQFKNMCGLLQILMLVMVSPSIHPSIHPSRVREVGWGEGITYPHKSNWPHFLPQNHQHHMPAITFSTNVLISMITGRWHLVISTPRQGDASHPTKP
jgi:hypothetical protein